MRATRAFSEMEHGPAIRARLRTMKEDYFDKAISFNSLYRGLKKSCRNVRWKDSVVGYETNGLKNTAALCRALEDGTYKISRYQVFQIHEPKERTIVAARLVDRQFQRSLCDAGLYQDFTEHFIRDNVACQIGKGTDDAFNRMKVLLRRHYRKHGTEGWVLKCDVHHFFPETRHDVAKAAVRKLVSDKRAAEAVCDIIDSFGGEKGIGLGSQVSQLVELAVLNDLDHFIKEKLRIKVYLRYMDDFALVHRDKEYLQLCREAIRERLAGIGLELNRKTCIHPLRQGVRFLKWRFLLTGTGRVLMLLDPKKLTRQRKRLRKLWAKERVGHVAAGTTAESLQSFLANAARGDTWRQRQQMMTFYRELIGGQNDRQQKNVA